ncbi:MAG TPA: hypothetical protein VN226_10780 [Anaerolineales bacterium]|nr:hypothetical protein [Anaerolineales bacterium]
MNDPQPTIYCKYHPNVETYLRCARCGDPICAKCAIKSPTGYLCKDCTRNMQKSFDTAEPLDYVIGAITSIILFYLASLLMVWVSRLGFFAWIILIAGSPAIGNFAAEIIRKTIRRHRSRELFLTIVISAIIGSLPQVLGVLLSFSLGNIMLLVFQVVFLFLAIPAMYMRLSGIQLFK